jgi:bifunctional DNA-binding transcriptional regulator/antitoxin component of YhaV-PrlF toxin-antitoxin module
MVTVVAVMSVSTEGIIRLSKNLIERIGVKAGDRLVVMKENDEYIIQIQREDKVIFRFKGKII